jgi:hypothetical protein
MIMKNVNLPDILIHFANPIRNNKISNSKNAR